MRAEANLRHDTRKQRRVHGRPRRAPLIGKQTPTATSVVDVPAELVGRGRLEHDAHRAGRAVEVAAILIVQRKHDRLADRAALEHRIPVSIVPALPIAVDVEIRLTAREPHTLAPTAEDQWVHLTEIGIGERGEETLPIIQRARHGIRGEQTRKRGLHGMHDHAIVGGHLVRYGNPCGSVVQSHDPKRILRADAAQLCDVGRLQLAHRIPLERGGVRTAAIPDQTVDGVSERLILERGHQLTDASRIGGFR